LAAIYVNVRHRSQGESEKERKKHKGSENGTCLRKLENLPLGQKRMERRETSVESVRCPRSPYFSSSSLNRSHKKRSHGNNYGKRNWQISRPSEKVGHSPARVPLFMGRPRKQKGGRWNLEESKVRKRERKGGGFQSRNSAFHRQRLSRGMQNRSDQVCPWWSVSADWDALWEGGRQIVWTKPQNREKTTIETSPIRRTRLLGE